MPPTPRRPELRPAATTTIRADLTFAVADGQGAARARLTNRGRALVLDVEDPATLVRCLPSRHVRRDLPFAPRLSDFVGVDLVVMSHGRRLGRARISQHSRLRFRPSLAGLVTAIRLAVSVGVKRLGPPTT